MSRADRAQAIPSAPFLRGLLIDAGLSLFAGIVTLWPYARVVEPGLWLPLTVLLLVIVVFAGGCARGAAHTVGAGPRPRRGRRADPRRHRRRDGHDDGVDGAPRRPPHTRDSGRVPPAGHAGRGGDPRGRRPARHDDIAERRLGTVRTRRQTKSTHNTGQHFIQHRSKAPPVDLVAVRQALNDFRSKIFRCPTECSGTIVLSYGRTRPSSSKLATFLRLHPWRGRRL